MSIPQLMQAARALARGDTHLHIETLPTPEPGPGQILIKVESAGVNFSDVKRRRGDVYPFETLFPFVPRSEIAGTVVAHGPGVQGPPLGTDVFALAGMGGEGGYAQFAVSYAQTAIPIPQGLSLDASSVCLVAGTTASLLLTQAAPLAPGQSVLIPAATGGVGSFALQIARKCEAGLIIAAVGHASKREAALALGAHAVVDTSTSDWPTQVMALTDNKGVDVALEASGGPALTLTLSCLAPFGKLVVFGAASGQSGSLEHKTLERWLYAPAPNQSVIAFNLGGWFQARPDIAGQALMTLVQDIMSKRIRMPDIRTLPLEQALDAHTLLEQRKVVGKLVIKPWTSPAAGFL